MPLKIVGSDAATPVRACHSRWISSAYSVSPRWLSAGFVMISFSRARLVGLILRVRFSEPFCPMSTGDFPAHTCDRGRGDPYLITRDRVLFVPDHHQRRFGAAYKQAPPPPLPPCQGARARPHRSDGRARCGAQSERRARGPCTGAGRHFVGEGCLGAEGSRARTRACSAQRTVRPPRASSSETPPCARRGSTTASRWALPSGQERAGGGARAGMADAIFFLRGNFFCWQKRGLQNHFFFTEPGNAVDASNNILKVDRPNSVHPLIRSTPHLRPPPGAARPAPRNGRGGNARSHSWRPSRRDRNGHERGPGAEEDLRSEGVLFWALQIIPSRTKVAHGFVTSRSYRNGRGGINRRVIPTHAVEAARPMRAGWGRKGLLHG